ncbi:MAG TPA: NRAMP family divalent metal transporter [Chloroflexota bacterium]|nr:NRAMP family divalent metal transporter [Chloroflexota bacterium]
MATPEGQNQAAPNEAPPGPKWRDYLAALGPGLISGASDNDPTTVATMAVLGASTRFGLSWLTILVYPMLASIQMISAKVGLVARHGLQRTVTKRYGRHWGALLLVSVIAVNLVTIGADLEGGAAALGLLFHLNFKWFVLPYAVGLLAVLIFGSYAAIQRVLQYVLFVFVAYIISAFAARPDWGAVLADTIHPSISFNSTYIQGALALLGTTMTSYAYVWETIEEAEARPPIGELGLARADAGFGMLFAVSIFWFELIATGATLGLHHTRVQTAQQAAQALVPVAGAVAGDLFAIGLLASSILAVPVLAATTAYMVCSEFGWYSGLSAGLRSAWRFYVALAAALAVAVGVSYLGISAIQLLFVSGIVGGIGTPISLAFLLIVARDHRVMSDHPIGKALTAVGWFTALLIAAISVYFLWEQFGAGL